MIRGGYSLLLQSLPLGPEDKGQLFFLTEDRIVDVHGLIVESHGGSGKSQGFQIVHPLPWPGPRLLFPQEGPGDLEDRPHADPGRPPVQRVAAPRRQEDCVHIESSCRPDDGAHIGGIHDIFQDGDAARVPAQLLHPGQRPAAHGAEKSSGQLVSGELCQHLKGCRVNRDIRASFKHLPRLPVYMSVLCQNGDRLIACVQGPPDDLGALCDEKPILRPVPVQELGLCQPGIDVQLPCGKIPDLYCIPHTRMSPLFFCLYFVFFPCSVRPSPGSFRQGFRRRAKALSGLPAAPGWPGTKASLSCGETGACPPGLRRPLL